MFAINGVWSKRACLKLKLGDEIQKGRGWGRGKVFPFWPTQPPPKAGDVGF